MYKCRRCDGRGRVDAFLFIHENGLNGITIQSDQRCEIIRSQMKDHAFEKGIYRYTGKHVNQICYQCNGNGYFDWIDHVLKNEHYIAVRRKEIIID